MKIIKVFGWICIPFIMILIKWKKMKEMKRLITLFWTTIYFMLAFNLHSILTQIEITLLSKPTHTIKDEISDRENKQLLNGAANDNNSAIDLKESDTVTEEPDIFSNGEEAAQETFITDDMEVHFIAIGQGTSVLVILNGRELNGNNNSRTLLYDTGPSASENVLLSYLQEIQLKTLNVLVLSHGHEDHIGNASAIISKYDVGAVYMSDAPVSTNVYNELISNFIKKGISGNKALVGSSIKISENVVMEFLGPIHTDYDETNDKSAVLKITFGEHSFLLTGDIEARAENDIIESGEEVRSTVLLQPHHGSSSTGTDRFITAVQPQFSVIQAGQDNEYGHPTASTISRLKKHNVQIYRTDIQGDIVFVTDGNTISINKDQWEEDSLQKANGKDGQASEVEEVYYANCSAVRAAGKAPILLGDPGYAEHLDRDGDGIGCE